MQIEINKSLTNQQEKSKKRKQAARRKHMDLQFCYPWEDRELKICYLGDYYFLWNPQLIQLVHTIGTQVMQLANQSDYAGLVAHFLPTWEELVKKEKLEEEGKGWRKIDREGFDSRGIVHKVQLGQVLYVTTSEETQIKTLKRYALIMYERSWADTPENIAHFLVNLSKNSWGELIPIGILPTINHRISSYPQCTSEERVIFLDEIRDRLDYYRRNACPLK